MRVVDAADEQLAVGLVAEVEREDRLVELARRDERLLGVGTPSTEMRGHASPQMPSNLPSL